MNSAPHSSTEVNGVILEKDLVHSFHTRQANLSQLGPNPVPIDINWESFYSFQSVV